MARPPKQNPLEEVAIKLAALADVVETLQRHGIIKARKPRTTAKPKRTNNRALDVTRTEETYA
jgi:hypothetical protein